MATRAKTTIDCLILVSFSLASRLFWLTRYPVFNDEAIYLRYATVSTTVHGQLWYALADSGKQPLLYWIFGLAMRIFPDPLLAARLVTVIIASSIPVGCYILGSKLGSRRTGIVAASLVLVCPLVFFFDRLALVDSALGACFLWMLVALFPKQESLRLRDTALAGIFVGLSLWLKSTGLLFGLTGLFLIFRFQKKEAIRSFVVFAATIAIIFLPLYSIPEYAHVLQMAKEYTYSFDEILLSGGSHIPINVLNTLLVFVGYVSPVVVALVCWVALREDRFVMRTLLYSCALPVIAVVFFGKSVHGRYVVSFVPPILVLASMYIEKRMILQFFSYVPMAMLTLLLVGNTPVFFHIFPRWAVYTSEANQYVDGWSSGYGVMEALNAIDKDRAGRDAVVATRWDSGNPEDAMWIFAPRHNGLRYHVLDTRLPEETQAVFSAAKKESVYFVTRRGQYGGFEKFLIPLSQLVKPYGTERIEVFKVRI